MKQTTSRALSSTGSSRSVVTVCDKKFVWGAFLLIASLRYRKVDASIHVLTVGVDEVEARFLAQFDQVGVIPASNQTSRGAQLQKAEALLGTDTETIAWIDADSIVNGDITPYLVTPGQSLQVRFREPKENPLRFRKKYAPDDDPLAIPRAVLETWQKDVGENRTSAISTACSANCFVCHRNHKPFIERWERQMGMIKSKYGHLRESPYTYRGRVSDELVLNSLLAFAKDAPPTSEYLLDKDPDAHIIHFGENPKPWERWQKNHIHRFDDVLDALDWARTQGYETPPIPRSLHRPNKALFQVIAYCESFLRTKARAIRKVKNRLNKKQ